MDSAVQPPAGVSFGRFRVLPHRRELLANGQPIKIGGRAFDVLMAFIHARGAVLSKDALMACVWPGRIIEENSLHAQISALRAAFGADHELIRTIYGHGYQFTGEIRTGSASPEAPADAKVTPPPTRSALVATNLPEAVSDLIGRDDALREVLGRTAAHRLVTLTGAGGIGKTRLALAVARSLLPEFPDGVWFAELAPVAEPDLVPAAVAAAVGLDLAAGALSPERVADALSTKRLLLVLDNCEHVIDAAAVMAMAVMRANPAAHVLVTSREPLRTAGEQIYAVPPLAVPVSAGEDPWQYDAVRLFVVRARASGAQLSEDRHVAALIAAICRQLDGIPLAIELAAARAATLGTKDIAARLADRFELLTGGQRTALPRHQTLRATLDWSYKLLAEPERVILNRLAIFAGVFSLEAAGAAVASADPARVVDGVSNLVAKSMIVPVADGAVTRYRLLETTRAYALERLAASGEAVIVARRHAAYFRDVFAMAETERETRPPAGWLADSAQQINDLHAALDWGFSPAGDASIAVALTTAALGVWMHLSLPHECLSRVQQALAAIRHEANCDAAVEMKLRYALAATLLHVKGIVPEIEAAWTRVLDIAGSLDDALYQLRALWGLWFLHMARGEHRAAVVLAQKFRARAAELHFADHSIGERMIGAAQHYLGDLASARRHIERTLPDRFLPPRTSRFVPFLVDQRVMGRMHLAPILWLQGFPDQAVRAIEHGVAEAQATNHALSLCWFLAMAACPVALWTGDLATAAQYVDMLLDHSAKQELRLWRNWARRHQGVLAIKRGDFINGLALLHDGFDEFGRGASAIRIIPFMGIVAEALGRNGQIADSFAAIEDALARTEETEGRWLIAELLRIKGELLLLQGTPVAAAEDHFRQALDWARRQGALSWELRAATSLARLMRDHGRSAEALPLLQLVYDRFTEGFATADLKAARALLDALQ